MARGRSKRLSLGSSPLARGLQRDRPDVVDRGGIIPARAGFTRRRGAAGDHRSDHPRSRGVYRMALRFSHGASGSSPLARGLPAGPPDRLRGGGIIPARAGFTRCGSSAFGSPWDHPRSRGVYSELSPNSRGTEGSSPLARGLHPPGHDHPGRPGIIPARAGFTTCEPRLSRARRDHPRSRGVYVRRRLRGEAAVRDHPRSRGVYPRRPGKHRLRHGSSPLARGLPLRHRPGAGLAGIIPARAGFTARARVHGRGRRDHPRSRGVY